MALLVPGMPAARLNLRSRLGGGRWLDRIVITVVVVALAFDYTNGFHDAANAIATSVSTRALTPRVALVLGSDSVPHLLDPMLTGGAALAIVTLLFTIGITGILVRRNMITVLMSIELVLNSVNLNLIAFSYQWSNLTGQVFAIFTITVAAGEAAVGLGILIALFRLRESTGLDRAVELRG